MTPYEIAFVVEQTSGHATHAKNLKTIVADDPEVRAHWSMIPFGVSGLAAFIPIYGSNWTVRAGLRARRSLGRLARREAIDALFVHTQVPAVFCSDWLRRMPSFVSLDATPLQVDAFGGSYGHAVGSAWAESLKRRLNRRCYDLAHHLITWSAWTKLSLVSDYGQPEEKITVVPPGVRINEWRRPQARSRPDGPIKILFVGRAFERKGGRLLLDAFRDIRYLGAELHLVTHDAVAAEPGVTVYRDMQPNTSTLKALYQNADIFALPTYADCLPMVLQEAGAAGLAIVSTAIGAIPEIVQHGETGLLVPVGDPKALTVALRTLVLDRSLRQTLAARAAAHIAQDYDADKNAARLLTLIKTSIERAGAQARHRA